MSKLAAVSLHKRQQQVRKMRQFCVGGKHQESLGTHIWNVFAYRFSKLSLRLFHLTQSN